MNRDKSTAFSFDLDAENCDADDVLHDIATALHLILHLPLGGTLSLGQQLMVAEAAERCEQVAGELVDQFLDDANGTDEAWGDDDTEGR